MYQGKSRRIVVILLGLYTILTLFFLFVGFNRSSFNHDQGLRYHLTFEGIPLHFPMGRDFQIWFFDLGNFLAFIPFGMVIPLLYRCSFTRFICFFMMGITVIELIQMFSRLGAFDLNDIIINTLGAAVGYWSQRIIIQHRDTFKGMLKIALTAVVISTGMVLVVGGINHYLDNVEGEVVALNELAVNKGTVQWDANLTTFAAGTTQVEPQLNLYSLENKKNNEFSYLLNGNYAKMEGYVAISGNADDTASSDRNEIIFIADGAEIYSISLGGEREPDSFQFNLKGTKELIIKVFDNGTNPNTNIVMWDVTLAEVNTGQRMINRITDPIKEVFK